MNNPQTAYPFNKVLLTYTFTGGAVGGFITGVVTGIIIFAEQSGGGAFGVIETALGSVFCGVIAMMFGTIFGFIPALFTGFIIASLRIPANNSNDYAKVGIIGLVVSAIYILPVTDYDNPVLMIVSIVGGVSAMLIATYILPNNQSVHIEKS